jgi:nucleoside-diphosphate-sugar epimerase
MKKILITGAGGLLGRQLLFHLKDNSKYFIYALTSNKQKLNNIISAKNIETLENNNTIPWTEIDTVLHCAFARNDNVIELAKSLEFCEYIFCNAIANNVPSIINISSQGVYGQQPTKWTEDTVVAPVGLYALAKFASEVILNSLSKTKNNYTKTTNIRLSSLLFNARFINIFVNNALQGKPLKITGENQKFSFMDVRDAADGLIAFLATDCSEWDKVYNLGTGRQDIIVDIANLVKKIAIDYTCKQVSIEIEQKDIIIDSCMDASKFYNYANWKPRYNIKDIIVSLFEFTPPLSAQVADYKRLKYPFTFLFQ